jgi:hypothetical protein
MFKRVIASCLFVAGGLVTAAVLLLVLSQTGAADSLQL